MDLQSLLNTGEGMGGMRGPTAGGSDEVGFAMLDFLIELRRCCCKQTLIDNAETITISSLALLKMLKHGRAGVPLEVMGLMLGLSFVTMDHHLSTDRDQQVNS